MQKGKHQKYLKTYKTLEKIGILNHVIGGCSAGDQRRSGYDTACILAVLQNLPSYESYKFDKLLNVRLGLRRPFNIVGTGVTLIPKKSGTGEFSYGRSKLQLCLAAADLYRQANNIEHHFLGCVFLGPGREPLFIHSDEFVQKQPILKTPCVQNASLRLLRGTYSPKLITINRTPYWKAALILTRARKT